MCEDDLQSFVQMGFSQNPNKDMTLQSQGKKREMSFFFSLFFARMVIKIVKNINR